jgi:4-deoxy-L-threo-5-hexosulose-uronate ketol-isomerase
MKIDLRYASHPEDFKNYGTGKLRKEFLIENIFIKDEISLVYSMYDRYVVGGAMPVEKTLILEPFSELKAVHFLDRREMGIINIGGEAEVSAGKTVYKLGFKEAIYIS